jgi:hypothetical protein
MGGCGHGCVYLPQRLVKSIPNPSVGTLKEKLRFWTLFDAREKTITQDLKSASMLLTEEACGDCCCR